MAVQAKMDQQERKVTVSRQRLLEALRKNRESHVRAYLSAVDGYRDQLRRAIDESFGTAKATLDRQRERLMSKVGDIKDSEIGSQSTHWVIVDAVTVRMPPPKCYASEYDAAIAIAEWDTREELELTYAEFTCFVRDEWDWKSAADDVIGSYTRRG